MYLQTQYAPVHQAQVMDTFRLEVRRPRVATRHRARP